MKQLIAISMFAFLGCADAQSPIGVTEGALTAEQCDYFEVDGRVTICHATSSTNNPYVILKTDEAGCINGHEDHEGDSISPDGKTCGDKACFPEGAPVDDDEKCCSGKDPVDGVCTSPKNECLDTALSDADKVFLGQSCNADDNDCIKKATEAATAKFNELYTKQCQEACSTACGVDPICRKACFPTYEPPAIPNH